LEAYKNKVESVLFDVPASQIRLNSSGGLLYGGLRQISLKVGNKNSIDFLAYDDGSFIDSTKSVDDNMHDIYATLAASGAEVSPTQLKQHNSKTSNIITTAIIVIIVGFLILVHFWQ
ncbi:MAG: hypothetical protein ACREGF_03540, partial [Candidatus Saccharimonadales bacterium]